MRLIRGLIAVSIRPLVTVLIYMEVESRPYVVVLSVPLPVRKAEEATI